MAVIAVCIYDTEENGRFVYTKQCLESIFDTVDIEKKHDLVIINQRSSKEVTDYLLKLVRSRTIFFHNLKENIGTARGINLAIKDRRKGDHVIKCDNDVQFNQSGWADRLEEAANRDQTIGIAGLKRNDLEEYPEHPLPHFKSELYMLPHEKGQDWIICEKVQHVMGTCTLLSNNLLDKSGYMWQKSLYALDDYEISVRSTLLGFKNVFLSYIPIEHLDIGGTDYTNWKIKHAGEVWDDTVKRIRGYQDGTIPLYYDGGF